MSLKLVYFECCKLIEAYSIANKNLDKPSGYIVFIVYLLFSFHNNNDHIYWEKQ